MNVDEFIEQQLRPTAQYLEQELRRMAERKKHAVTREMIQSIAHQAMKNEMGIRASDAMRMVDMGAGRGYRKGQYVGNHPELPHNGRKGSKFYSRTAYGIVYGRLVNLLMNGFAEGVAADTKKQLSDGLAN